MPFLVDFQCSKCNLVRTVMLRNSQSEPDESDSTCPDCQSKEYTRCVGGNYLQSNDPQVRSAMLKKRSLDHSKRTFKDNLERVNTRLAKKGLL